MSKIVFKWYFSKVVYNQQVLFFPFTRRFYYDMLLILWDRNYNKPPLFNVTMFNYVSIQYQRLDLL